MLILLEHLLYWI